MPDPPSASSSSSLSGSLARPGGAGRLAAGLGTEMVGLAMNLLTLRLLPLAILGAGGFRLGGGSMPNNDDLNSHQ